MIVKYFLVNVHAEATYIIIAELSIKMVERYLKNLYPTLSASDYEIREVGEELADAWGRPLWMENV